MNKIILSILMIILIGYNAGAVNDTNTVNMTDNATATPIPTFNVNLTNVTPTQTINITNISNGTVNETVNETIPTDTIPVTTNSDITNSNISSTISVANTPNVIVTPVPTIDVNIKNNTPTATETPEKVKSHKQKVDSTTNPKTYSSGSTNISIQPVIIMTSVPASTSSGIFGDFYDKILLAVIIGFIGLSYEIVRINYDHKKKNESEKTKLEKQEKNEYEKTKLEKQDSSITKKRF